MSLLAVASRTCLGCGAEFESNHGMRSYCFDCRPPGGKSLPEPLPVERVFPGDPFTVEHFRAWAAELTLDTGEPWVVEPFFEDFLDDFFAGFAESWLLVPEGNTKTTSMSGLGLYHCEFTPFAMALWAASARDQAELGYLQAEGFIMRSSRLQSVFKCHPGYRRIAHRRNGARLQIFASDDRTGDGVIPTLGLLDELHRHRNMKLYRTWRGKLPKRGGQLATFSTAGEPGSDFEETRERIRQTGEVTRRGSFTRAVSGTVVLHEHAVPEGADVEDMAVVKDANPFSGITVEMLREKFESPTMTLSHWRRFVCNLPTRDELSAIEEAEWHAAACDEEIPTGEPVWVGLDVAWKWDTTAAVPLWFRDEEFRLLGPAVILEPPRDGTSLDPGRVERALAELHERTPIHTVVMDMSRAEQLAVWLETELGCVVVDRSQGNQAAVEDYDRFMEALRQGWLRHSGDAGLTRHALNAIARILPQGDARFERPMKGQRADQDRRVIDALVAAAMVHSVAAAQPVTGGVVFA